jgi:hypothetical protein
MVCTKFSLLLKIVDRGLDCATEEYGRIDNTQELEGFRRGRNIEPQKGKLCSILAEQRRRKESLLVILYLDIKNAFK